GPPRTCRATKHPQGRWKRGQDSSKQKCSPHFRRIAKATTVPGGEIAVVSDRCGVREELDHNSRPERPGKSRQRPEGAWPGSYHLGKKPATLPNPPAHTPGVQRSGCPEIIGGFGIQRPRADEKITHNTLRYVRCVRRGRPTIPATK